MANFNKVILIGNLTRDPELRYTPKGTALAKLSLAVNRTWRTETGESKEEVTFVDIEAWGRQAETLSQYMKKGNPLLVEGRLRLDTWEDKQTNQKRSKLAVVVEGFQFLGGGGGAGGGGGGSREQGDRMKKPAPEAAEPEVAGQEPPPAEDDVPF